MVVVVAVLVFIISNMACAVAVRLHQKEYSSIPVYLLYVRVAINDSLFVIFAIALSVCMFRMTKMSSSSLVLEAKVRPKHKKSFRRLLFIRTKLLFIGTKLLCIRTQQNMLIFRVIPFI